MQPLLSSCADTYRNQVTNRDSRETPKVNNKPSSCQLMPEQQRAGHRLCSRGFQEAAVEHPWHQEGRR